jgi:hypothetical protein
MAMDPRTYRAQVEADYAKRSPRRRTASRTGQKASGVREVVATLRDKKAKLGDRQGAVREIGTRNPISKPSVMNALLRVLSDNDDNDSLRLHCLTVLAACAFQAATFSRYSADYTEALRAALDAKDPRLRERAMDALALRNDPYAQQLLIEGLRDPAAAAVPPAQAVRMLGYDTHGEHYAVLRDIAEAKDEPELRNLALQALAADSGSTSTFATIAADSDDDPEARATSAVALKSLAPQRFNKLAQQVIADDDENDAVRATMLTALTHSQNKPSRPVVAEARRIVDSDAPSEELKAAAGTYLDHAVASTNR